MSLRSNVVVADAFGVPAAGVKTSASSSLVIADAVPVSVYAPADDVRSEKPDPSASEPPPESVIVSVSVALTFKSPTVTPENGVSVEPTVSV